MHDLAAMLRSLHESPVPDLPRVTPQIQQRDAHNAVEDLSAAKQALASRLGELRDTLDRRLVELRLPKPATLHNDLHGQQIRLDGGRLTLLDPERMAIGDPLIDVANLAAQLRLVGCRPEFGVDSATAESWAASFVDMWESYVGHPIDIGRFRCYTALSLLTLARGMMRHLRPGWRELAGKCVSLAQAALAGTYWEVPVR